MADFRRFEEFRISVPGGQLAVLRWPAVESDAPTVVAAHGITANALAWASLAEALDGRVHLVAPDLRGRGRSRDVTGPWGIAADADDVIAVLDHTGLARVVLVGHSMGAFVASVAAARHPDRVGALVAVDGGLGYTVPEQFDPDAFLEATVGPAFAAGA